MHNLKHIHAQGLLTNREFNLSNRTEMMEKNEFSKIAGSMVHAMIAILFLLVVGGNTSTVSAQVRWKGTQVGTVANGTTEIFLYNVGTGKFLSCGGDWGVEGRLFYDDFGRVMKLNANYQLDSDISTKVNKSFFGCNVPKVTCGADWGSGNCDNSIFTTIMDGDQQYSDGNGHPANPRKWIFERIPGETGETFTYYMHENLRKYTSNTAYTATDYYLGAAYGESHRPPTSDKYKGDGYFVYHDDDRVVWTTANVKGNTTQKTIFSNTQVTIDELYQWRIVTKAQLIAQLNASATGSGLSANVSYLINDYDFTRNDKTFYNSWTTTDQSTGDNGRYKYTWGYISSGKEHQANPRNVSEKWDKPIRLKAQWNDITNAKFGFMTFEGKGTVSSSIDIPAPGIYQISCYGFYQGDHADDGYLYASFGSNNPEAEHKSILARMPSKLASELASQDRSTSDGILLVGKELLWNGRNYMSVVTVNVTAESGKLYFGVGKDKATRSESDYSTTEASDAYYVSYTTGGTTYYLQHDRSFSTTPAEWKKDGNYVYYLFGNAKYYLRYSSGILAVSNSTTNRLTTSGGHLRYNNNWLIYNNSGNASFSNKNSAPSNALTIAQKPASQINYYHDKDWIAVDNFQIIYLGTDYVMFDEEQEDLQYIKDDEPNGGFSRASIGLRRTFIQNKWNSFVFPLPLSAVQVRTAFGDKTELAVLDGLGTLSGNAGNIDFRTVQLPAEGTAIEAGKFYLIKPVNAPMTDKDGNKFYNLGIESFKTSDFATIESQVVTSAGANADKHTGAKTYATYVRTANYDSFSKTNPSEPYVPAHSYVISNDDMYYTQSNMKIKGFRGWLRDTETGGNAKLLTYDGIYDMKENGIATGITYIGDDKPISTNGNTAVYDLSGRKLRENDQQLSTLPKGLYIINGKKYIVK